MRVPRSVLAQWTLGGAAALFCAALFLVGSHASVHSDSTNEDFPCLASWDIVLNDAYNDPDGDPQIPGEHIGERCVSAAQHRFWGGAASGATAVGLFVVGLALLSQPD